MSKPKRRPCLTWVLNRVFLANVLRTESRVEAPPRGCCCRPGLLPLGIAPPVLNRRYALDTSTCRGAVARSPRAGNDASCVTVIASLPRSRCSVMRVGDGRDVRASPEPHGNGRGVPRVRTHSGVARHSCCARAVRAFDLRAPPRDERRRAAFVGLLGPALPASLAAFATTFAFHCASSLAAMAACPFAAHALTVTLAGRDGRSACRL